ncbi:hypothetical protein TELCIR_07817 [Teladorsagia circumcincta]|uniref:Uncharacterized protein n=1 Tax=Teladorsagia circumcincta TaxID=45464 RepID=A0A2G9UJB4_TELCI|nr:hypothetical protein TELCIR_07817 [Teladorsagia circumcincta]
METNALKSKTFFVPMSHGTFTFHSYAMPIEIATTQGLRAQFIPLGATLTSLFVKDRDGNEVDIVLGFDSLKGSV